MEIEFSRVIDALPGLVWTARPDGQADFLNRRWLEYTGLDIDAALGSGWLAVVHPDDAEGMMDYWRSRLAAGESGETEARLRRFDGSYRWFHFRTSPVTDDAGRIVKWCGVNTDIEDRKQAEAKAHAHERRFRAIVEGLPAIVTLMTPDGEFAYGNQHMIDYLGAPFDELKSRPTTQSFHPDDRAEVDRRWKHSVETGEPYDHEARLKGGDGAYRWFHTRGFPLREPDGSIALWYLLQENIDERKRAEEERAANERNLKLIVDTTPALMWASTSDGNTESVNQHFLDYVGMTWEQLQGRTWALAIHPDDQEALTAVWAKLRETGQAGETEARLRRHDGAYRWFLLRANPLRDENGNIVKWYGVNTDIEDRKRAEEAVAASERNLKLIIDTTPALIFTALPNGETESVNRHFVAYSGLPSNELQGEGRAIVIHPDDQKTLAKLWRTLLTSGEAGEAEARLRRHDGEFRWFLLRANALRDDNGNIVKWYGVCTDIEDRKRADEALRAREREQARIIDTTPALIWTTDTKGRIDSVNKHYVEYVGMPLEQMPGQGWEIIHPDDLERLSEMWKAIIASGSTGHTEARLRRHDGVYRWFLFRASPMHDETGKIVRWYGVNTDIEDRKRTEQDLRRSEASLAQGEAVSATGNFLWRLATNEIAWSRQMYRTFGFEPGSVVTLERIASRVHPDDLGMMEDMVTRARAGEDSEYEHRLLLPDGTIKYLHFVARATRDDEGAVEYVGVVQDVTERKRAEQALSKVRSELAHVSRVSTLGALTASIAHEVNQPLAGIVTNASTCLRMLGADPPNVDGARETARRTIRDGNRAAEVITRLRALFGKKEASFELLDLNDAVREVIALSLNELQRNSVVLRQELADNLPPIAGDRVQLQQVILNLVLNATDAMSEVKDRVRHLTIKTDIDEDEQVRLSVRDTGMGFDSLTSAKMFDAFYTTKAGGMGIGLSVSRSIIDRHQGRLWATSNEGPGATFSFSIPCGIEARTDAAAFRASAATDAAQGTSPH